MRWQEGISALSHSQTSCVLRLNGHCAVWIGIVLCGFLITMCHCIGQNSYMGHSSPSPLWISDDQAGTGRAVHSGSAGLHPCWQDLGNSGWCLGWIFTMWSMYWLSFAMHALIFVVFHMWAEVFCHWRCHISVGPHHVWIWSLLILQIWRLSWDFCPNVMKTPKVQSRRPESWPLTPKHCILPWLQHHPSDFPYRTSFIKSCIVS